MTLPETTTYSDFRENLSSHLKRVRKSGKPTLITQNGKTAAVVMGPEAYEQLVSDAEEARSIERLRHSFLQAQQGKVRPVEEAFAHMYRRLGAKSSRKPRRASRRSRRD